MIEKNNKLNLLIKIANNFPKKNLIFFILLFIKFLPIFIYTHDWDLKRKKGYSYYLNYIILVKFIYIDEENKNYFTILCVYKTFSIIIFILNFIILISIFHLMKSYKKNFNFYSKSNDFYINILSKIIFYFYYFLNQFIFSIFVEIIFEKNKDLIYFIFLGIILINFLFILFISLWINSIIYEPLFIENNSFFSMPITRNYNTIYFYSFIQIFIQIEFHIKFNTNLYIKNLIRACFFIFYIFQYFDNNYYYVRKYYYYAYKIFSSMCFISLIIEWATYNDRKNDLIILVKYSSSIIIKFLIEILSSFLLTEIFFKKEKQNILNTIYLLTSKEQKYNKSCEIIKLLNLFYFRDNYYDLKFYIEEIFNKKINTFKENDKKFYDVTKKEETKNSFNLKEYLDQKDDYLKDLNKNNNDKYVINSNEIHIFSSKFPLLYDFLKLKLNEIVKNEYNNKQSLKYIENLFALLLLLYTFEKNFYKSYYLIELLKKTKIFKDNIFFKSKVEYFFNHVNIHYKNFIDTCIIKNVNNINNLDINSLNQIKLNYVHFNELNNLIIANDCIKKSLNNYYQIIFKIQNEIDLKLSEFYKLIVNFNFQYKNTKNYVNRILKKKLNHNEFINFNNNFQIFEDFFEKKIIKKEELLFFNKNNNNYINENSKYYILVFKIEQTLSNIKYKINYCSENLLNLLKYSLEEIMQLEIHDIFPKKFSKHYTKLFNENIKDALTTFKIKNFFICDKKKFIYIFDLYVFTLFYSDNMRLYLKFIKKKNENENNLIISNKKGKITYISKSIEKIFFTNSQLFNKCDLYFEDFFRFSLSENSKIYTIKDLYNTLLISLNNTSSIDISQKIGDEEHSKIINKINEMIKNIENAYLQNIQIIFNLKKQFLAEEYKINKEFYLINIKVYNPVTKSVIFNLKKYVNGLKSNIYSQSTNFLQNKMKINNFTNFKENHIKNDLIDRIKRIRNLSISILKIFYRIKITNIDIYGKNYYENSLNNEENKNNYNNNNNNSNIIIEKEEENEIKNFQRKNLNEILSLANSKPFISFTKLIPYFIIQLIIIVVYIVGIALKCIKLNQQKDSILYFFNAIYLHNIILNIFNGILLYQLKSNNLQNLFFPDFQTFQTFLYLMEKDFNYYYLRFQIYDKDLNKINVALIPFMNSILFNNSYPFINGSKYEISNENFDFLIITNSMKFIADYDEIINFYNDSEKYFYLDDSDDDIDIFYTRKAYIIIIDNLIVNLNFYMNEYKNYMLYLIKEKNLYGNFFDKYFLIIVSIFHAILWIFIMFLFLNLTKYSFIRYFIVYNQTLFFNIYLNKKINFLLDFIFTTEKNIILKKNFKINLSLLNKKTSIENKIEDFNKNKKLNNLFSIINLSENKEELENLEEMIKENVFESVHQIRINPFSLEIEYYNNNENINKNHKKHNSIKNSVISKKSNEINKIPKSPDAKSSYFYRKKITNNININKIQIPQNQIKITKTNPNITSKYNNSSKDSTNKNFSSLNSSLNMSNSFLIKNKSRNSVINNSNNNSNLLTFQTGHKLLKKNIKFLYFRIFFPMCLSFFICLDIYEINRTKISKETTENILNKNCDLFNTIFILISSIQIHIYSLLANKDPIKNYTNKGFLDLCNLDSNKNKMIEYNVFQYNLNCYIEIQSRFEKIINGNFDSHFSYMKKYFNNLFNEDFCEVFTENLRESQKKEFFFSNSISYELNFIEENCKEIGNFTSKGLLTIVQSFYNEIVNLHNDFINNKDNNKNIKELINNKNLILLEKVCFVVLGKVPTTFGFAFFEDFDNYTFSNQKILIIFVFAQFVMVNILTVYFTLIVYNYIKEEENIIEFGERLGNSILY